MPDRGQESNATQIAAAVGGQWIELPQDMPSNYDVNDYALEFGYEALSHLLERLKAPTMRYKLLSSIDLLNAPPMRWLVQGVLPAEGLAALYGASGSGKSFLTLDMGLSLAASADDMIALAGAAACSIVDCLSTRQIKILAILTTVKDIRPLQKIKNIDNWLEANKYIIGWWSSNISPLVDDGIFDVATSLDYEHLAAMGCIRISIGSSDLLAVLSNGIFESVHNLEESLLINQRWYTSLKKQWDGLGHATATSTGRIIGILHRDTKLKTNTRINW